MISAGRVLLMPKGAYDPSTTYEMLDIVSYNGSSYIAKGTTTGNLPTNTTYWQLSAYGGQASNVAGNFAEIEVSDVASRIHYVDDIFVDKDSRLVKATQTINVGDTIDENVNCTPTTVEALISYLSSYVDSLDSLNKKIQGAIEIAAQTDLHSLALGEYYKKQTTFYVTNAPVGINQVPSALFRLTVEAALDNASQANSPLLLTLRTLDGKIYTQSFDGTAWESWEELANENSVATKQNIIDNTLQTTSKTVPGAINELNSKNEAFANNVNVNGCKNSITIDISAGGSINNISWNVTEDGTTASAGTASGNSICLLGSAKLPSGTYILSGCPSGGGANSYYLNIADQSGDTSLWIADFGDGAEFTLTQESVIGIRARVVNGYTLASNLTFYPMICLKSDYDLDTTYTPPTKTNHQLTQDSVTWDNLSEVGAVNYCKNNATTTTTTDGTTTFTWTVNDDKSVTISAPSYPVTLASNQIFIPWDDISADECSYLVGKVFKLTGCPSGGSRETYRLQIYRVESADGSQGTPEEYGTGKIFTWNNNGSGTKAKVQIVLASGYTMTGPITFKPMLTDPSYNGPYVPYAKTNKELTDDVTPSKNTLHTTGIYYQRMGKLMILKVSKEVALTASQWNVIGTLNSLEKPDSDVQFVASVGSGKAANGYIEAATGDIKVSGWDASGTVMVRFSVPYFIV